MLLILSKNNLNGRPSISTSILVFFELSFTYYRCIAFNVPFLL